MGSLYIQSLEELQAGGKTGLVLDPQEVADTLDDVVSLGDPAGTVNAIFQIATFKGANKSLADILLDTLDDSGTLDEPSSDTLSGVAITLNAILGSSRIFDGVVKCTDTDYGALDSADDDCMWYKSGIRSDYCGRFDDSDFSANEMCCACGGGQEAGENATDKNGKYHTLIPVVELGVAEKALDIAFEVVKASGEVETGLPHAAAANLVGASSTVLASLKEDTDGDRIGNMTLVAKHKLAEKVIRLNAEVLPDILLPGLKDGEIIHIKRNGMSLTVGGISPSAPKTTVGAVTLPSLDVLVGEEEQNASCPMHISNIQWPLNPMRFLGNRTVLSADNGGGNSSGRSEEGDEVIVTYRLDQPFGFKLRNPDHTVIVVDSGSMADLAGVKAGWTVKDTTQFGEDCYNIEHDNHRARCQINVTFVKVDDTFSQLGIQNENTSSDCCEVDDSGTQTTELRGCGRTYNVHNLAVPIEFEVPTAGVEDSSWRTYDPTLKYDEVITIAKDLRSCQYWDASAGSAGSWSSEGCWVLERRADSIRCACNHMSLFGGVVGKTVGKLGDNNADLLLQPFTIDFSKTSFQALLFWLALLYLPCFLCHYKDGKDYEWLKTRNDLFLDKIPKGSGKLACAILPSLRICVNVISIVPRACMGCFRKRRKSSPIRSNTRQLARQFATAGSKFFKTHAVGSENSGGKVQTENWNKFCDMEESQLQRKNYVGAFGPEVGVPGMEPHKNHLLWPSAEPPLRDHIWLVASRAQEETIFAREFVGFEYGLWNGGGPALAPKTKRGMWTNSVKAVRRFHQQRHPASGLQDAEHWRAADLETQVMNVKICHLLVEHECAQEMKLQAEKDKSRGLAKHLRALRYKSASKYAEKKREVLLQTLTDLLAQGNLYSVSSTPPPLHAASVEVVELKGTLPPVDPNEKRNWRSLCSEEDAVSPGQQMLLWLSPSGDILLHEAKKNSFGVWNMLGGRDSIKVPLVPDSSVQVQQEPTIAGKFTSKLILPLIGDCFLTLRLLDKMGNQRTFEALEQWRSSRFFAGSPGFNKLYRGNETCLCDNEVLVRFKRLDGYTCGPRTMRSRKWQFRKNNVGGGSQKLGFVITSVEENGEASSLGLEPGMELISLDGEDLRMISHKHVLHRLRSLDDDNDDHSLRIAVFSKPVVANVEVIVRGHDIVNKSSPFSHHGMMIEFQESADGSEHAWRDGWCGFREYDEIITIDGKPAYSALGNTQEAKVLIEEAWKKLHASTDSQISFGVRRSTEVERQAELTPFFELSSVFRYTAGASKPHSASPTLTIFPDTSPTKFAGSAWMSHCGLVLSIQLLEFSDICIGVYLEDIRQISGIQLVTDEGSALLPPPPRTPPPELVDAPIADPATPLVEPPVTPRGSTLSALPALRGSARIAAPPWAASSAENAGNRLSHSLNRTSRLSGYTQSGSVCGEMEDDNGHAQSAAEAYALPPPPPDPEGKTVNELRHAARFVHEAVWTMRKGDSPSAEDLFWKMHNGYIPDGDDIFVGRMTIEEAKLKCMSMPDCRGFTHVGPPTSGPVIIYFKTKTNIVLRYDMRQWTSYLKDEALDGAVEALIQTQEKGFRTDRLSLGGLSKKYRLTFGLSDGLHSDDLDEFHMESESEFTLRLINLTVASSTRAIEIARANTNGNLQTKTLTDDKHMKNRRDLEEPLSPTTAKRLALAAKQVPEYLATPSTTSAGSTRTSTRDSSSNNSTSLGEDPARAASRVRHGLGSKMRFSDRDIPQEDVEVTGAARVSGHFEEVEEKSLSGNPWNSLEREPTDSTMASTNFAKSEALTSKSSPQDDVVKIPRDGNYASNDSNRSMFRIRPDSNYASNDSTRSALRDFGNYVWQGIQKGVRRSSHSSAKSYEKFAEDEFGAMEQGSSHSMFSTPQDESLRFGFGAKTPSSHSLFATPQDESLRGTAAGVRVPARDRAFTPEMIPEASNENEKEKIMHNKVVDKVDEAKMDALPIMDMRSVFTNKSHFGVDNESNFGNYWETYRRYIALYSPERGDGSRNMQKDIPPTTVAAAFAYQAMPNRSICFKTCFREQVVPKLMRHIPSMTRLERYATITSAVQTSFFVMSFLFSADCHMVPAPSVCIEAARTTFLEQFIPTWDVVFAMFFGIIMTAPVPLFLMFCFRKTPVVEKLSDKEKSARRWRWRMWQIAGWAVALPLHGFYIYWFVIFTNKYSDGVLEKQFQASFLSLGQRFLVMPALRALVLSCILISSKFCGACDAILVAMLERIILPGRLDRYDPDGVGGAFDAEVQFNIGGDEDIDLDFGDL